MTLTKTNLVRMVRNDMKISLEYSVIVAKLSCIIPVDVNIWTDQNGKDKIKSRLSLQGAFQRALNIIIIITISTGTWYYFYDINDAKLATLTKLFYYAQNICYITSTILITFGFYCHRKKVLHFADTLLEIFVTLRKIYGQISLKKLRTKTNSILTVWIIILLITSMINGYLFYKKVSNYYKKLIKLISYLLVNWLNFLAVQLYCTVVNLIEFGFDVVNKNLMNLLSKKEKIILVSGKIMVPERILITLLDQHYKLQLLYEEINGYFGLMLLISMLMSFNSLTTNFFVLFQLSQLDELNVMAQIYFSATVIYIAFNIFKVYSLLLVNERTQIQV